MPRICSIPDKGLEELSETLNTIIICLGFFFLFFSYCSVKSSLDFFPPPLVVRPYWTQKKFGYYLLLGALHLFCWASHVIPISNVSFSSWTTMQCTLPIYLLVTYTCLLYMFICSCAGIRDWDSIHSMQILPLYNEKILWLCGSSCLFLCTKQTNPSNEVVL